MRPIWDGLRRKVERVALPEGVIGPQADDEFGDVFGIVVTPDRRRLLVRRARAGGRRDAGRAAPAGRCRQGGCLTAPRRSGSSSTTTTPGWPSSGQSPLQLRSILDSANIIIHGRRHPHRDGAHRARADRQLRVGRRSAANRGVAAGPAGDRLPGSPGRGLPRLRRSAGQPGLRLRRPALALGITMRDGGNIITLGDEVSRQRTERGEDRAADDRAGLPRGGVRGTWCRGRGRTGAGRGSGTWRPSWTGSRKRTSTRGSTSSQRCWSRCSGPGTRARSRSPRWQASTSRRRRRASPRGVSLTVWRNDAESLNTQPR